MQKETKYSISHIFSLTTNLLSSEHKKKGILVIAALLINALIDVLALAAMVPVIAVSIDRSLVHSNEYLKRIYMAFEFSSELNFAFYLVLFLLIIFVLKAVVGLLINYFQIKYAFNLSLNLSRRQFKYYYGLGIGGLNKVSSGDLIYDVINVPYNFASFFLLPLLNLLTEIVVLVCIFVGILIANPTLVFVLAVVLVPSFTLVYLLVRKKVKVLGDQRNEFWPINFDRVSQAMKGYIDVVLANKEQYFLDQYLATQKKLNRINILTNIYKQLPSKVNEVFIILGILIIFLLALWIPGQQEKLLFVLAMFAGAAYRVVPSFNKILSALISIRNNTYVLDKMEPLIKTDELEFETVSRLPINESIQLANINFSYGDSGAYVLDDLSFSMKKGEVIGFIGESGSGKTTLLNIILGFLHGGKGKIYIDGEALTAGKHKPFQKNIGYVQQNVFIANTSIAENVAFGNEGDEIDAQKIEDALKAALLWDYVSGLEKGSSLVLGEEGSRLSGGQKQRIGIARALYKDADLILLDEATSALDIETEAEVTQSILELKKLQKTIMIVAHRVSTLKYCDRIYELKNGKIIGEFTFDEVMARNNELSLN